MGGHLFVLRGDLTQLHCSAVLIPCDAEWRVAEQHWGRFLPEGCLGDANEWGWAPFRRGGTGRFTDVVSDGDKRVRLVVTADDDRISESSEKTAQWVAQGVVEAIADLSIRVLPTRTGRVKGLIGLPLVGTGAGGLKTTRGALIEALLPKLSEAARNYDVDVALVLIDERDHAAVQAVRDPSYWNEFANERPHLAKRLADADELGHMAARGELSLFLGSGVSVPLGVPDWKTLLTKVGGREIEDFDPDKAPQIAQRIEKKLKRAQFEQRIVDNVDVPGVAPTHMLLAGLAVGQAVTTNYDVAYERALDQTVGRYKYQVLTRQLALQPHPWLLKLHGCVTRPKTIVITSSDYKRNLEDLGALQAVIEALMMTSHLLFVGFSMGDQNFVQAANRVKAARALAEGKHRSTVATVLALDPDAVEKHAGFEVVSMLDGKDHQQAARMLEIFLDRVSWKAATHGPSSNTYLLHPNYRDLFDDDVPITKLREMLGELVAKVGPSDPVWGSRGWKRVAKLLSQLGDDRFTEKVPSLGIGTKPTMEPSKPCVYVIELNDAVRNDKKFVAMNPGMRDDKVCVYVGHTGRGPEVRFAQHLEGYKSCKYVKNFGERLRPDLVPNYENGFKNSREAEAAEARLAARLRKRGHGVWQN